MKKIVIVLALILLVTGCGSKEAKTVEEKHGKENKEITESLKKLEFGTEEEKYFDNLMILDSNTIRTELGIREERVENYVAAVSYERNGNYYIAIKPKEEWKDYVKNALDLYTKTLKEQATEETKKILDNSINTEINGYYVYISSNDNDKVLSILKSKLK